MGLQEKRRIQTIQNEVLPKLVAEVQGITGHSSLDWFINWPHLYQSMKAVENIENIGFPRIVEVFKNVCLDDLGRTCVQRAVKRVDFIHSEDPGEKAIQFVEGVLSMIGNWAEASADGWPETAVIQTELEKGL